MTKAQLLILIAIIAVIVVIAIAVQRSGPRVTTITRRKVRDNEGEKHDA